MSRRRLLLLAACCLAASLAGPGCARSNRTKKLDIVLVTKALDSEFWQRMKSGAEQAAREDPEVRLAVLAPEREINIDQQVAILEDQILKRVAALAVAPAGVAEIIPVLDKAHAAGIPVLIVDTDIPWPHRAGFVGIDNRLGGRMAAEFILRAIGARGKVAVIRGVLGVATQEDRLAGFLEVVRKVPGVQFVGAQPANSERALGMTVMENLLTRHPDLRAVFATNDQMALGAMEAIAARNLTGKIVLVGFDAGREAVRAVLQGRMDAVVAQFPERIGYRAVREAIRAARGEPVEKFVDIGTGLVTRENAHDFLR
ncbi:MAG: sugar ABC transporter substrate-binding protein [Bryobacterales bacterium]|nr:sugar ABC transporter substrate-binding protein [Bryobacteraceae bacterium]MDW8131694.1 sugar ABC transporter substrate-binding protein [Bryobacterales bacterium]